MRDYISIKKIVDGKEKCIELIQLSNGDLAIKKEGYSKECQLLLQHEYELYETIRDSQRIVPNIIDTDGNSYFIEEYIEGLCLEKIIENKMLISQVDALADAFEGLHSKSVEALRYKHAEFDNWKNYLIKNVEAYVNKISCINSLSYVDIKPVYKYVYKLFSEMDYDDSNSVILHNDLNGGNIIFSSDGEARFLDFERWVIGDQLKELSKMVWFFRKNKDFGWAIYNEFVNRGLIKDDLERLKAYFFYDILFHLSLYNELKYDGRWKKYLEEEIDLIKIFGTFILW